MRAGVVPRDGGAFDDVAAAGCRGVRGDEVTPAEVDERAGNTGRGCASRDVVTGLARGGVGVYERIAARGSAERGRGGSMDCVRSRSSNGARDGGVFRRGSATRIG